MSRIHSHGHSEGFSFYSKEQWEACEGFLAREPHGLIFEEDHIDF